MPGLRRSDILGKFMMEKLQILFVEENLVRSFHSKRDA